MPAAPATDRLRAAPWLKTAASGRVFAALATTGATSRAVGGAVRNTLLGQAIDDIDIATAATPDAVLAAAARAGLTALPLGLKHGTVTLIADGTHFEVTTLRRDVATDGRHATVVFTDDWALDASRRDFTINALYCDADGTLFDPLGGVADLRPTRIRFIGDADQRIREDYLRILRFFRFSARYADGPLDADGIAACARARAGLRRISTERKRAEMFELLVEARAPEVCRIMQAHGFLVDLLGSAPSPGRLERLATIEVANGLQADPLLRLAALALTPCGDAVALAHRWRLSGSERDRLATLAAAWAPLLCHADPIWDRRALFRFGARGFCDALLIAWAGDPAPAIDRGWHARLALARTWTPPVFSLTGDDVLALGVPAGPEVGRLLSMVADWWIDLDFIPDRAACLVELIRRLRARRAPPGEF